MVVLMLRLADDSAGFPSSIHPIRCWKASRRKVGVPIDGSMGRTVPTYYVGEYTSFHGSYGVVFFASPPMTLLTSSEWKTHLKKQACNNLFFLRINSGNSNATHRENTSSCETGRESKVERDLLRTLLSLRKIINLPSTISSATATISTNWVSPTIISATLRAMPLQVSNAFMRSRLLVIGSSDFSSKTRQEHKAIILLASMSAKTF